MPLIAMASGKLSSRVSLRDIVSSLSMQGTKLYHLGLKPTNRSTHALVNNEKPYSLYEGLFSGFLVHCQNISPKHKFKFKNKLYSLNTTAIDLWLGHSDSIPVVVSLTEGKMHELS